MFKLLVHCFVMPNFHTQQCPDATTHNSKQQQSRFGDTPSVFHGLPFVNTIYHERDSIENDDSCVYSCFHREYKGSEIWGSCKSMGGDLMKLL